MDKLTQLLELVQSADDEEYLDDPFSIREPGTVIFEVVTNHQPPAGLPTIEVRVLDYWGCASWANEGGGLDFFLVSWYAVVDKHMPEGSVWRIDEMEVSFTRGDGWTTDDDEDWEFNYPRLCAPWVLARERWHTPLKAWGAWARAWWHNNVAYRWRQ